MKIRAPAVGPAALELTSAPSGGEIPPKSQFREFGFPLDHFLSSFSLPENVGVNGRVTEAAAMNTRRTHMHFDMKKNVQNSVLG